MSLHHLVKQLIIRLLDYLTQRRSIDTRTLLSLIA